MNKIFLLVIALALLFGLSIILMFGTGWGILPFMLQECETDDCWNQASAECSPAKYFYGYGESENEGGVIKYYLEIRGRDMITQECIVYVKILHVSPPDLTKYSTEPIPASIRIEFIEAMKELEDKDMVCKYENGLPALYDTISRFEKCSGSLRDAIEIYKAKLTELDERIRGTVGS